MREGNETLRLFAVVLFVCAFVGTARAQQEVDQTDPRFAAVLSADLTTQYAPAVGKPCPDQWKAFENAIRLERQVAADSGASYYITPESKEELVRIVLGNPYVEPLRVDHAVPAIDDELSVWVTHLSKPTSQARQVWGVGYRDPANTPGRQFVTNTDALGGEFGLFKMEVRYRNLEGPDAHVYATIGGAAMCAGNASCGPEIRSWDRTNRTLRSAQIWRSVLKVPQCQQLTVGAKSKDQEWSFGGQGKSTTSSKSNSTHR